MLNYLTILKSHQVVESEVKVRQEVTATKWFEAFHDSWMIIDWTIHVSYYKCWMLNMRHRLANWLHKHLFVMVEWWWSANWDILKMFSASPLGSLLISYTIVYLFILLNFAFWNSKQRPRLNFFACRSPPQIVSSGWLAYIVANLKNTKTFLKYITESQSRVYAQHS